MGRVPPIDAPGHPRRGPARLCRIRAQRGQSVEVDRSGTQRGRFSILPRILLELTSDSIQWAIFDLGENPVPTYYKGRVAISGDAAHATSPHHGAGAGFCIEDTAVLAALLEDKRVQTHKDLQAVLAAFDENRRERTQWLVQSSRFIGDCYEWRADGVGSDFKKIEEAINHRNGIIANVDIGQMCQEARKQMEKRLNAVEKASL